jgi:hypothetical protein
MANTEREKGRKGEAEVAAVYRSHGLTVRGLEATGDHVLVCDAGGRLTIHSEVKRQETARPWAWWEQASSEAEPGSVPVVAFRRNRSPWLVMLSLDRFAELLELAAAQLEHERQERDAAADR